MSYDYCDRSKVSLITYTNIRYLSNIFFFFCVREWVAKYYVIYSYTKYI